MASDKEYLEYILDLLGKIHGISHKKMMGEYLLYKDDILFGGVYDNRFLVKKTKSTSKYHLKEQTPYPGAKTMLLVDSEDPEEIEELILYICKDLTKS